MGDAGPTTPLLEGRVPTSAQMYKPEQEQRVVTVLLTGFGPFKSFITNPSYLIAKSLPEYLYPEAASSFTVDTPLPFDGMATARAIDTPPPPPIIRLLVHPEEVRVAYETVAQIAPALIAKHDPDFVMHIGMAGGREYYTLETLARRDAYKIKDVDDKDGTANGENVWKEAGLPETLWTGWNEEDVLARWRGEVARTCPGDERAVVRLSRDAGRFLCEFILYTSLAYRVLDAREREFLAQQRIGKAAFLHVPGGVDDLSIARGRRIAEAAIRAFVASWEAGYRRQNVFGKPAKAFAA